MTKYRKKPVVIEAVQFTRSNHREILDFTKGTAASIPGQHQMIIPTREGDLWADVGDWIIKGVQGEFYPVKPDIFEETYELVVSDQNHTCGPYIDVDVVAHRCIKYGRTSIYEVVDGELRTNKLKFIGVV